MSETQQSENGGALSSQNSNSGQVENIGLDEKMKELGGEPSDSAFLLGILINAAVEVWTAKCGLDLYRDVVSRIVSGVKVEPLIRTEADITAARDLYRSAVKMAHGEARVAVGLHAEFAAELRKSLDGDGRSLPQVLKLIVTERDRLENLAWPEEVARRMTSEAFHSKIDRLVKTTMIQILEGSGIMLKTDEQIASANREPVPSSELKAPTEAAVTKRRTPRVKPDPK